MTAPKSLQDLADLLDEDLLLGPIELARDELRRAGMDPDAIAERGAALGQSLFKRTVATRILGAAVGPVAIVCGGRDYQPTHDDAWWLRDQLEQRGIKCVRHGAARGVDAWAGRVAVRLGLVQDPMPANWSLGKRAGPLRNRAMLDAQPTPVVVLALPGGRGTADMCRVAVAGGVEVVRR